MWHTHTQIITTTAQYNTFILLAHPTYCHVRHVPAAGRCPQSSDCSSKPRISLSYFLYKKIRLKFISARAMEAFHSPLTSAQREMTILTVSSNATCNNVLPSHTLWSATLFTTTLVVTMRKRENAHSCISSYFYAAIFYITSPYLLRLQFLRPLLLYRVIHKSVKHFKNSQQIHYSTDRGSSYADRERSSQFFYILHRCSMCPPLVIRQTSMR